MRTQRLWGPSSCKLLAGLGDCWRCNRPLTSRRQHRVRRYGPCRRLAWKVSSVRSSGHTLGAACLGAGHRSAGRARGAGTPAERRRGSGRERAGGPSPTTKREQRDPLQLEVPGSGPGDRGARLQLVGRCGAASGAGTDAAWSNANVLRYSYENFRYEVSLVVTGDGHPVFGQVDGRQDTAGASTRLGPELAMLVGRAATRHAGGEPKALQTVLATQDGLFIVAASPIVPYTGSELGLPPGPLSVLVFGKRLDEAFLQGLQQDLGIRDPRLAAAAPGQSGPHCPCRTWRQHRRVCHMDTSSARSGPGHPDAAGSARLTAICGLSGLLVTVRDRAERAINESEARFRDIPTPHLIGSGRRTQISA